MFAEHLDFLMGLTNTQASALGMACHLDPSHVSRLRNGTRPLPKKPAFLHDMSLYFARRITVEYQKNVLCAALKLSAWPADEEQAAARIESWLAGDRERVSRGIGPLLAGFAGAVPTAQPPAEKEGGALPKPRRYYFGPTGKQEAMLQFFDLILKEKTPQTLYLTSDEEMGWLYEDPAFAGLWLRQFTRVIQAGNRVKIVHSIGRDLNEMLEAVSKWLPVYTTGMVEPYYYPKVRDGVLRRTLFLAPRTAAVTSVSVGNVSEGRLNELITDRDALTALAGEYEDFLALCRPLMEIITLPNREDLWRSHNALMSAPGATICMSDRPTLATMPQRVAKSLQERAPGSDILREWRAVNTVVRHRREEGGSYVEIVPEDREEEPPALPCGDLLGAPGLRYTPEEWQTHREAAARFGDRHPEYRRAVRVDIPRNICLIAKEGRGVIMTKTDAPGVAFAISEPSMVNSFWDYLTRLT